MTKAPAPKILVVDDDVRLRDLLTRYLAEQGFQVAALADARNSTTSCSAIRRTCVVLDLMLPGEDGLSVCRRLRGAGETVPIIMLTAKGEDVDRIVGLEMGADDYLPSRSIRASSSRASTRCCAATASAPRPARRPTKAASPFGRHTLDLAARTLERDGKTCSADHRRVLADQGVRRSIRASRWRAKS